MRNRSISILSLALCVAGCGSRSAPAPQPSEPTPAETVTAAASEPPATVPSASSAATIPVPSTTGEAPAPAVPVKFRALGTEPFWNAEITDGTLRYTTPEDQNGQRARVSRINKAGGAEFSGKLGTAAVHLNVNRQNCSDGMSDRTYRFTAILTIGSERRAGCAD